MATVNYSIDPIGTIDSIFDFSGNKKAAERQQGLDNAHRNRMERLDQEKWFFQQQVYREQKDRQDSQLQRMIKDAKLAGISPSLALGVGGHTPTSVPIPGSTSAPGGRPYNRQMNLMSQMGVTLDIASKVEDVKGKKLANAYAEQKVLEETLRPKQPELPLFTRYKTDDGGTVRLPHSEAAESMEGIAPALMAAYINTKDFFNENLEVNDEALSMINRVVNENFTNEDGKIDVTGNLWKIIKKKLGID